MAISFRSLVKRSKACSIVEVSVFGSTTKKFFCASGGGVTCYDQGLSLIGIYLKF